METVPSSAGAAIKAGLSLPRGLLLAFSDPPPGEEAAFDAWYNEHAPSRLTVPGVSSARRYQAVTDEGPRYMACYDLESPQTLATPEYRRLRDDPPASDREMMPRLPLLQRRVLNLLLGTEPWIEDPPYQLTFSYDPAEGTSNADVVAWYREEHIPLLLQIEGWRRVRLYERLEGDGPRIVALHELESPAVFETDGYRHATSTPWRERIVGQASRRERYLFKHLRSFAKP
jgi:hypothetical protein